MIDFLLLYENKNREKIGLYLIKNELERRGYSVQIRQIHYITERRINAKVLILPFCYDNNDVFEYIYSVCGKIQKVINLRCEQILNKKNESNLESFQYPKGEARKLVTISWGKSQAIALRKLGMNNSITPVVGAIQLDLLRWDDGYSKKEDICQRYGLSPEKKILLFISSFSLTTLSDERKNDYQLKFGREFMDFINISCGSKNLILNWLTKFAEKNIDYEIIYRPHPSEKDDELLKKYVQEYENFHVISNETVSQWIKISDSVFNWFSTSAVEVYMLGKGTNILRPYRLTDDMDIRIFDTANRIENYEDFVKCINLECDNSTNSVFESYYGDFNNMSYKHIADIAENLLVTKEFSCGIDYKIIKKDAGIGQRIKSAIYPLYSRILKNAYDAGINIKNKRYEDFVLSIKNTLTKDEEIYCNEIANKYIESKSF